MKKVMLFCVAILLAAINMQTLAADTYIFGYCGEYSNGIGTGKEGEIGAAIEIPADKAAAYAGSKMTKMQIAIGQPCKPTFINIFISEGFDKDPLYTEEVKITNIDGWNEFTLKTPYEISDKGFVVGYKVVPLSPEDYPIGVDAQASTNEYGDWVFVGGKWMRLRDPEIGNVCVRAVFEGENFPTDDIALSTLTLPTFVKSGEAFTISGEVMNVGLNEINSFEIVYEVGDAEPVTKTFEIEAISNNTKHKFEIPGVVYNGAPELNAMLKATITKVNGNEDSSMADNSASSWFWTSAYSFDHAVVVEEGTGIWCGFCPMGIVALDKLSSEYPDSFIGIAVHGDDVMESASYIENYPATGFPICNINRYYYNQTPSPENLEIFYQAERQRVAYADVEFFDIAFNEDNTVVTVTTETTFAVNATDVEYRLAYVLLENKVGPYNQTNYYANNAYGEMGGWEKKAASVKTTYNDVARDIFDYHGIENSLESTVVEGKKYKHTYDLSLANVGKVKNLEIVALLINYANGEIVNAKKITSEGIAGICEVEADENIPAVFYNLQGVEVSADKLVPGVYVKRIGDKAEKVFIK